VPQLSSGWQHNNATKTRLAGCTDEQSMYFLMSMIQPHSALNICSFFTTSAWVLLIDNREKIDCSLAQPTALFWLSSFVGSHHLAVGPQTGEKDQF
jgi:hypothetical protein